MVLTLREALKSLCSSNGWSYAVFWRLKSPDSMILTWEDGHCESTKPAGILNISTFTAPDSLLKNWESGGDLLDYGIRSQDRCSMQDQIELLVSKMSQQMHSLQEGIVGSIASSGKHQWIIMENLLREWSSLGPLNPCSSFEYPDGWQTQLAAGIKTIAFIAAAPYGVVQLGSKQTIIEDLELVTRVKSLFGSVYNLSRPDSLDSVQELLSGRIHETQFLPGNRSGTILHGIPKKSMLKNSSINVLEQGGDSFSSLATSKGIQVESYVLPSACSSSSLAKSISQFSQLQKKAMHLSGFTSSHNNDHKTLLRESRILPTAQINFIHSSATTQAPLSPVMDRCTSWGMTSGQHGIALQETVGNHVIPSSLGDDFISAAFGIGSHSWDKDLTAKDVSSLFQDVMVDDLYPGNENCKDLEAPFGKITTVTDDCAPGFDDAKSLTTGQENCTNSIALPAVDELFDVLHPVFKKCKTQDQVIWDDILLPVSDGSNENFSSHSVGVPSSLQCPARVDVLHSFDASMDRGFEGGFYSDRKSENLLDAVVANICPPVNHSAKETALSNITFSGLSGATSLHSPSVKTNSCLSGTLSSSDKSKYVGLSRCGDNASLNTIQSLFKSGFQGEISAKGTSNNTFLKSQLSSWIEDSKSSKGENLGLSQAKKPDEPVKVNRKRAKPGESTRPRPKDRQQIQDRVKELREIVPNGSKCSIDALLERTIKHMLFLQSVTKHADKLKHSGDQKGFYKDLLLRKDNQEGDASWALEVDGQSMGCPIIVENMSQPRQMLVEMLCEERGLFLEIADIIRGLDLTILKGVMEARKDKIWARFAVEASRDVQRVEILWSLMQLLQQNKKNTTNAP